MIKKAAVIILSLMMAVVFMPEVALTAAADDDTTAGTQEQMPEPAKDPFNYTTESAAKAAVKDAESAFPEFFDLRNVDGKNYVTPVKFQNPFGSCWGFAAIAAAESSILGNSELNKDGEGNPIYSTSLNMEPDADGKGADGLPVLDLSEKQIVYFSVTPINDPANSQNGEGTYTRYMKTASQKMNAGGFSIFATSLFSSGVGPVLESYPDSDGILEYHGKDKSVIKKFVPFDGKKENYCYDDEDDWSLGEKWRFRQSYVLKESYMLPSPATKDEENYKYTYNPAGTAAIKDQLMQNRAVEIGFCADTYMPGQEEEEGQYINDNWAHYTYEYNENVYPDHAVTIVGWDDNYPKENFAHKLDGMSETAAYKLTTPKNNGAWLVKNSWGSGQRQFPYRGPGNWGIKPGQDKVPYDPDAAAESEAGTGYFWLSYYDKSIETPEALEFDRSNVDSAYNLDQYDFMPVTDIFGMDIDSKVLTANVFKANGLQTLEQVSCQSSFPGTTVTSRIYLLRDAFTGPTDGKLMDKVSATYEYGGFHKMPLNKPLTIQKGQSYAVVQEHKTKEGSYAFCMPVGDPKSIAMAFGGDRWQVGVINKKESYLYYGKWMDYSLKSTKKKLMGGDEVLVDMQTFDNFPIKGYAEPEEENIRIKVSGRFNYGKLNPELRTGTLKLDLRGDADLDVSESNVEWSMPKSGEEIIKITPYSEDPTELDIEAKKLGSTYVYATVDGVNGKTLTKVMRINVRKDLITDAFFDQDIMVYNGKARKPRVSVFNSLGNKVAAKHYTITWANNKKCGKAKATVKAKASSPTYRGTMVRYFQIIPARSAIKKMETGKKKLTVTIKNQKASGVDSYQFRYKVKGTGKWLTKTMKAGKNKTKITFTGLKKGKRYVVKVRAKDKISGFGKFSKAKVSEKIK